MIAWTETTTYTLTIQALHFEGGIVREYAKLSEAVAAAKVAATVPAFISAKVVSSRGVTAYAA